MADDGRADAREPAEPRHRSRPLQPFANAFLFTRVPWLFPAYAMPWGELGSLVYFAAVVAVVFVAAIVVVNRRDA